MSNILYLIDNKINTEEFIRYIRNLSVEGRINFYLCPITTDKDTIDSVKQEISAYGEVTILPFILKFNDNGFLYKDKFIRFLSDFSSGRNNRSLSLRKYFAYPFADFSTWWFSLLAEKNTVKNEMYHNFVKFMTILNFQDEYAIDKVYIDIEDDYLKRAIFRNTKNVRITARIRPKNRLSLDAAFHFVKALGYFVYFILRKAILLIINGRRVNKRERLLRDVEFLLITFFPFSADRESLKRSIFKNKVFGPLEESIQRLYQGKVAWFGIEKEYSGLNVGEIRLAKKVNSWGYNLFLLEELVSFRKSMIVFSLFLFLSLKFLIKIPYLSRNFVFKAKREVNVWDIFQKEWIYSFLGANLVGGLFYYHAFSSLISTIKKEATVIYPSEMQWWENALNIARKRNKKIRTVGIQHSSVPLLFLSYFNLPVDLNCPEELEAFPLPDYFAVSGSIPHKLLLDSGWPKKTIFNIGAMKYHRLSRFLEKEIEWKQREKKIIVALSFAKEEIEEVLLMLKQSFKNENILTFVIRPHTGTNQIHSIINASGIDFHKGKFILDVDTPLENLLVSSRGVIVTSSTVSLDAISCQCPVIIPKLSCRVDMNPLSSIAEGLVRYVDGQDELKVTVKSIIDSEKSPIEFNKCRSFFNDYFTITNNKEEYFMRLKSELLNK